MVQQQNNAQNLAEDAAVKAAKPAVGAFYWSTVWVPAASYLWTIYLIFAYFRRGNPEAKLLNKWQKWLIVLLDVLWFFLLILAIALIAYMVCEGGGNVMGKVAAWFFRWSVQIGTLGGIDFGFCEQLPTMQ